MSIDESCQWCGEKNRPSNLNRIEYSSSELTRIWFLCDDCRGKLEEIVKPFMGEPTKEASGE